jgi:mannose-1-phosphate guanylyltransferase
VGVGATQHVWVIVLAGGEGTRLLSLTTDETGVAVPKQYCSFDGRTSLVRAAVDRARRLTARERVVAVVSEAHEAWWSGELADLPRANVVVQPSGRGTAVGVLAGLAHVLRVDPRAAVVVLPADHHVENEELLADALRETLCVATANPDHVVLLGMEPQEPDTELGWILPAPRGRGSAREVAGFVEKPDAMLAAALMRRGALWSTFMLVATGRGLLRALAEAMPDLVETFMTRVGAAWREPDPRSALGELYARLPSADFSRDVLERVRSRLLVMRVPACGWTDLGTPARVAEWWARRGVASRRVSWPARNATRVPAREPAAAEG